ncbi:ABC transporter permease [Pontibacter sp. E15-1]|uniref:ABC transporter permease n=1 Tax=Pontibacter sp. E15-1 TaxID=2919918 RepID=UPI001F4F4421|nr:ABC transporter permease [Pontibacter sp. E15-1]MCJ8163258.1 ABC transporter permease [Pontibacter sp. E15-1]
MRTLLFLLQKEFRQIFRDKAILRMIFVMPILQLVVLPWAADYEMKNIRLSIVDHDNSPYSQELVHKITASGYFLLNTYTQSFADAMHEVEEDRADLILEIPPRFERTLVRENEATLFMALNAINGVKANLGGAYLRTIIQDYNREVRLNWVQLPRFNPETRIEIVPSNWFNPFMNYQYFMVPGILVILVTLVGSFLTALNIVREKEVGTMEQINVTPIKKHHFILGKLIPFWILGLVVLTVGFFLSWVVYGIVPVGSFVTIYVFAAIYLLAVLGLGLLISSYADSQQQAMLISFFMMMVFILLSGLYTSIDSMPEWAQLVTLLNPVAYFIDVIRLVVLKGAGLSEIRQQLLTIIGFAVVLNAWAVFSYKKRS